MSQDQQRRRKHGDRPTEPLAGWPEEFGADAAITNRAPEAQPVRTDDFMVYGRAGNRRVDLEAVLRDALGAAEAAQPASTADDQWIFDLAAKYETRGKELFGPITFSSTAIVDFARDILSRSTATSGDAPADLQQLKALALAATPGPWRASQNDVFAGPRYRIARNVTAGGSSKGMVDERKWELANASFIAAANPAVVLDLIARIERQKGLLGEAYKLARGWEDECMKLHAASGATASGDELPEPITWIDPRSKTVYPSLKSVEKYAEPGTTIEPLFTGAQLRAAVFAATKPAADMSELRVRLFAIYAAGVAKMPADELIERAVSLLATKPAEPAVLEDARQNHVAPPTRGTDSQPDAWIAAKDQLPEKYCLAVYETSRGKKRIIRAMHVRQYEIEASGDECDSETNDADEMEYIRAGWYELIDNWGDHSSVAVSEGVVTHWMPLPPLPDESAVSRCRAQGGVTSDSNASSKAMASTDAVIEAREQARDLTSEEIEKACFGIYLSDFPGGYGYDGAIADAVLRAAGVRTPAAGAEGAAS